MMLQTSNTDKNLQTAKTNVTKPATSSYILNTNFFPRGKKKKERFTRKNLENRCHQNCIDQTKIEFSPHPESCLQIPAEQNLPIPPALKTLAYLIVV